MDTMDTKEDPRHLAFVSLVSFVATRTSIKPALSALTLALLATTWTAAQSTVPVNDEFFEGKIRPVLSSRCYACHSSKLAAPKGELVLDTKAGVLKGGRLGPAVVPGKPADSKLLEALTYANAHLQMPPSGKLADPIIADFERWIAGGAPDPRTDTVTAAAPGKRVVGESELAKGRQLLSPGTIYEVNLNHLVTSNLFTRGHRVRVQISSTFFPNFSRNLHTGELETVSSRMQPATIRLHHDSDHPSQVSLHVVDR